MKHQVNLLQNKILLTLFLCVLGSSSLFCQAPEWLDQDIRNLQFSNKTYLTGFAEGNINEGETLEKAIERVKISAQGNLLESIRVSMKSNTQSSIDAVSYGNDYYENETFSNQTAKSTAAEIVGMKTENYYDKKTKIISAFAYSKRSDVIDYYISTVHTYISQIDGLLQTILNLETNKEKAKARQQCELIKPLFGKIRYAQDMLTAIDSKISTTDLQQLKTEQLYNTFSQLQARLDVKYELIDNYKSSLAKDISQIEGLLKTAEDLENNGEKPKARQQCEKAKPFLDNVRATQNQLKIVAPDISIEDLQQAKVEHLHNKLTQMSARLAQATLVYVESNEDLFGQKVNIVANKLKAELAISGCSFIEDIEKADFRLKIDVSTRESSGSGNLVFCYADVAVELYDMHKKKAIYNDELAEKGGSSSKDKAARKAMENAVNQIINKMKTWLE